MLGTFWERAKPQVKTGEMMVDRLQGAAVISFRSVGISGYRWKREISIQIPPILLIYG